MDRLIYVCEMIAVFIVLLLVTQCVDVVDALEMEKINISVEESLEHASKFGPAL